MVGTSNIVRVDAKRAFRKLVRVEKKIILGANKSTETTAKLGKFRAREIAPYYSGKTARFIRAQRLVTNEGDKWQVQAMNPTKGGAHRHSLGNYPDFNLVVWMHHTNGILNGKKHIKSGDPQFMLSTKNYLIRKKRGVANATYDRINFNN